MYKISLDSLKLINQVYKELHLSLPLTEDSMEQIFNYVIDVYEIGSLDKDGESVLIGKEDIHKKAINFITEISDKDDLDLDEINKCLIQLNK